MLVGVLAASALGAVGWWIYRSSFRIESRWWIRAVCRAETEQKVVALTFDDGTHPAITPAVLDILKREHTPACFFVVGARIDNEILRRMDREGHIVGNHTYDHRGMGPFASTERMTAAAEHCDRRIEEAIHRRPRLFRPPFGVSNPMIGRMVRRRGYTVVGWSIRSLDTLSEPRERILERIRRGLHPGAIILLHDNREGAPRLVEGLLAMLHKEGYRVVRIDELLKIKAYEDEI